MKIDDLEINEKKQNDYVNEFINNNNFSCLKKIFNNNSFNKKYDHISNNNSNNNNKNIFKFKNNRNIYNFLKNNNNNNIYDYYLNNRRYNNKNNGFNFENFQNNINIEDNSLFTRNFNEILITEREYKDKIMKGNLRCGLLLKNRIKSSREKRKGNSFDSNIKNYITNKIIYELNKDNKIFELNGKNIIKNNNLIFSYNIESQLNDNNNSNKLINSYNNNEFHSNNNNSLNYLYNNNNKKIKFKNTLPKNNKLVHDKSKIYNIEFIN